MELIWNILKYSFCVVTAFTLLYTTVMLIGILINYIKYKLN